MAYRKVKRPVILSHAEQEFVKQQLQIVKKFFKPVRGKFTLQCVDGSKKDWIFTARYYTEDDIKSDAEEFCQRLCSTSKKKWKVVSVEVLGRLDEQAESEETKS